MSEKKEERNPNEYGYLGDEIISVPVKEYWALKELVDEILVEETKPLFQEKYHYVDRATGKVIEKLTDKNKEKAVKMVNVENTLDSTPVVYRTPRGMTVLRLKLAMNKIHLDMIEAGVASHIPTMEANQKAAADTATK